MRRFIAAALCCLIIITIVGCGKSQDKPSATQPVTITIWHTYVEQMGEEFSELVEEFNTTIGAANGIIVDVGSASNANELNERLLDAADNVPGAPRLPDIALVYPKVALELADKGVLLDLGTRFGEKELAKFTPKFLEEGYLGGDTLYLMPVAKSTEVLYINQTFFEPFAEATGVTLAQLSSVEGMIDAAQRYYEWTDAQTPDIPQDGKAFYYPDNPFNFAEIGFSQMGSEFFSDGTLDLQSQEFERIWNSYYPPAVRGGVAIFNNYGNYIAMTGGVVCVTSTSAGTMFYPDTVTYTDNSKQDVVFDILPYPIFEGGEKVAMQRGGGFCIIKSDAKKEYAASVFIKWLTDSAQNLRFTSNAGYLPVENSAFDEIVRNPEIAENAQIRKMLITAAEMQREYRFFIPSVANDYNSVSARFSECIYSIAKQDRARYLELIADGHTDQEAYDIVSADAFARFCADVMG